MRPKKIQWTRELSLSLILITLIVVFGRINPRIVTVSNLIVQLRNMTGAATLAVAILPIMITGCVDLSFMMIASFSRTVAVIIGGAIGGRNTNPILVMVIAGVVGALIALVNCFFVTKYKIPSIITSLAMVEILIGLTNLVGGRRFFLITSNVSAIQAFLDRDLVAFVNDQGLIIRLKYSIFVPVILSILMYLFLKFTSLGRHIYAVGGDVEVARRVGINVPFTMGASYSILGFMCGFFSVMQMSASPANSMGAGTEFNILACVILGGLILGYGNGSVLGTLLAVIITVFVQNSCLLLGVPAQVQKFMMGALLIASLVSTAYSKKASYIEYKPQNMR